MEKTLRYRIYGVIDVPVETPGDIQDVIEKIQENGSATVIEAEIIDGSYADQKPVDPDNDFGTRYAKITKKVKE